MKQTTRFISVVLTLALVVTMFTMCIVPASAENNPNNKYSNAAMDLDDEYAYDGELGAIYTPTATTFKVWAPLAKDVSLNLYATGSDSEAGAKDLGSYPMEKLMDGEKWTGVWTYTASGDQKNVYYTYTINNPQHIVDSDTYVAHETQDVYSKAVGVNGNRSMVVDLDSTDPEGWDNDAHVYVDHQTDTIVWEVQVKDFSWNENSGVSEANRGKFLAFTETGTTLNNEGELATGIDYLKELGITHVQINPFYDFATINEAGDPSQFNWGYDPKNYGVPEGSYSTNPYDGNVRINECKQMIKALHDAGIGVIMDVVYNHTYSIDGSFTYSVPEYYYRLDSKGAYSNQSGCGNDTASERAMYRKYMREMLQYWTNEYHIDGYRFDLMGVHDGETMNMIRDDMDAIDSRIIMYGEGWGGNTAYDPTTCAGTKTFMTTQQTTKDISTRIGFFNDQIRDGVKGGVFDGATAKGFVNSEMKYGKNISYGVAAQTFGHGGWTAYSPEQCVTYASCHDNMTLYDKLVACDHGTSADYRARYADCIKENKLTAAIISSCQGIDFILAGEEMGRSKDGDENSYKSAATLNMIDWSQIKTNADLVSYYKGMFELRKAFSPFTAATIDAEDDSYKIIRSTSVSATAFTVGYTVENKTEGEWSKVAVIYNGKNEDVKFRMTADTDINDDTEWVIVADGSSAGVTKLGECKGTLFDIPATSVLIAVEKESFEKCAIKSDFTRLTVNSVYEKTGEVLASNVLLGTPGSGYSVEPDASIPIEYELKGVDGDEAGKFGAEDKTISYEYEDFVPDSFTVTKGDVDGDGFVSILDATKIQRWLADLDQLDEEHIKHGDYDYSGTTNILDATKLQRYLADLPVNVCTITTEYIGVRDGNEKSIKQSSTVKVRLGSKYETSPASVAYYKLDETPANATGIASGDVKVTYHYTYSMDAVDIHIKHSGDLTWDPYLWAWAYNGSTPINSFESWPGQKQTTKDENGWYTTQIKVPGGLDYYFIINQGSGMPQTKDYGPISCDDYPEIWVVINDAAFTADSTTGTWISYYNYNPDLAN